MNRCNFLMNAGLEGGAAYIGSGAPRFLDCTFADGLVTGNGAGVLCSNTNATFRDCTFDGNMGLSTSANGGGLFIFGGASEVVECVFRGNSSGLRGGGLALDDNSASITNCRFVNNAATIGGGISVLGGAATVTNTEFDSNVASSFGGALSVDGTDAQITNCTLSFNSATSGGGVGIAGSSTAGISNSILWRNSDSNGTIESSQIAVVSGSATVAFSTVQGLDTFAGSNNIGTDPQFVDADGADGIPGNADDNLRLAPGSPAIDAGNTTALPSDAFDLDGDLDTSERLPIDLLGNDRLFDDLESVDTGNADPPTYLQVVDMGSYEYFTDCNNNGVVDAVDISMGTSQDCDSPSWPANGKPDECDIADCAGDPACDDCNLTGIPDACDIADGTSADLIGPFGVPDECAQFVDACNPPSDLWTDPCNWDLAGAGPLNLLVGAPSQPNEPPDSEALAMHGYPDNANGTSDVAVTLNAGDNVFLNESVTIPTLRLLSGAILRLTTASGSVTAAGPTSGTDLIIEDSTSVDGSVLVGGDDCICVGVPSDEADCSTCVPQGDALIGPGGRYMKDPDVAKESSAILLAINVKLNHEKCDDLDTQEQCEQLSGGVLELTDDMVVVATGDLVLDGALADTPCAEPFGAAIAAVQRFHTPPIKRITGRSRLTVSNNLTLINLATSANASTGGVTVGGAFDNQLTDASCFDWTQGKLLLDGTKLQTFEVAARDLGSVTDLSVADYVIGTLEVAANSHVTFTDNFVNDPKGSSRDSEALYVETLIVGPNATITLNDVRIYYKNPPIIGEQATIIRKVNGELRSIHDPHPALQPAPDGQGSEVPKNRFISLVIPEPAPGDDPKTAIQVKLITLNRTCSADSNNLFTPCSFDDDCVDGVCQTPFATGEGLVRYVNVVKTCQGAGAAGTKLCRGPADCGEAEECLQMRNCAGTSQLCSDDEDCGEGVACLATMSCPDDTFKPAFLCATTGCEPDYRDWAGDLAGGVLHIYGPGIVPGRSEYDVKQMAASCEGNERCTAVSATLRISTARWADLTADGATNAADIAAASDKVKPIPEAFTKPRTMLIPGILNPLRNVNVLELQNTIDAVKSLPMPGLIMGPQRCP
ncbi:MAG: right-handed parallel beta-helix repeat-containing protein [Planctomycetes bacterium]|nr:right-handed parallel beta-helix repeat-containing protein [Planctomycetota bacterium]